MKALRSLRILRTLSSTPHNNLCPLERSFLRRFYSAEPEQEEVTQPTTYQGSENDSDSIFDSSHYEVPNISDTSAHAHRQQQPIWDRKYRARADEMLFGKEIPQGNLRFREEEEENRRRVLAKALLEASLEKGDSEDEDEHVAKEEDQKSLAVGIIGAPNAGKSALTNYMAGTKVAAVSRKTNTTTHEVVGVMTKGDTQICFFDTPGLTLTSKGYPHHDLKSRVESAWSSVNLYEVLLVVFDVHRHLTRPDARVIQLIKRMGARVHPNQKRVLCMNKIDLVKKKKDLMKVSEEFKHLPGYERFFMISGLKGYGLKDLSQYLMEQAFQRPWEEDPFMMSEEVMKMIAMEVVRERLLDHVHQEIPYEIEHRLIEWKELRDGSLRVEQHFITSKLSQRKILVGKNGSKIGRIGMEANEELRSIFKKQVHLILQVRLKQ
ncbi:GTP-binding protein ERG-like [Prosopis cineraria]|uniref:GTP-binding protein ERG-like n=1 Tax=Prosopis cineraria TaxID=364024 RepID=UPI00240F042F|nr:GTP-binding protein ERG-like [Prosopis cineraria]XP_054809705.1 GTP-binding protein ERG-like [Prosopis cineraria]XP_054809706.1 GTP-binding protein ERG-like [Prosopis cineraria]